MNDTDTINNSDQQDSNSENVSISTETLKPCFGQITSDERTKRLQQVKDAVSRMLRYAVTNPSCDVPDELLNSSIQSLCKNTEDYSNNDEFLLLKVYSVLSRLISPASDISIQIAEELKDTAISMDSDGQKTLPFSIKTKIQSFFGIKTTSNKLVTRCYRELREIIIYLFLFTGLYVFIQCYVALLTDTLTNSSSLLDKLNSLQDSELLINNMTDKAQSEQIHTQLDRLFGQLSASNRALMDLTKPLTSLFSISLSESTKTALSTCANYADQIDNTHYKETKKLLSCIDLGREYTLSIDTVLSRYVLPLVLGVVGATAYVSRNILYRLSTNSYLPAPRGMLTMRFCLGGLLGAMSGIFLSSGVNKADGFNISLTLVALVMGYSVDVAFSLFDSAIDRLKAWTKSLRESESINRSTNIPNKPPD